MAEMCWRIKESLACDWERGVCVLGRDLGQGRFDPGNQ